MRDNLMSKNTYNAAAWTYQEVHRVVKWHCASCFSFLEGFKLGFQPHNRDLKKGRSKRSQISEDPGRSACPCSNHSSIWIRGNAVLRSDSPYRGDIFQCAHSSGPHINPPVWPGAHLRR